VFLRYANGGNNSEGEALMSEEDFIRSLIPTNTDPAPFLKEGSSFKDIFAHGKITFEDFVLFDYLLATPETTLSAAFHMFDENHNGLLTKEQFANLISSTGAGPHIDIDFSTKFWEQYFGLDEAGKLRTISEKQMLDLVRSLRAGVLHQEFRMKDVDNTGFISADDFGRSFFSNTATDAIPNYIVTKLHTVGNAYKNSRITFARWEKLNALANNLNALETGLKIVSNASGHVNREDFKKAIKVASGIELNETELGILFHIFDNEKYPGTLNTSVFLDVLKSRSERRLYDLGKYQEIKPQVSLVSASIKAAESFTLGGIAGAAGATAVYPIDLVKTRMQNQRTTRAGVSAAGKRLYANSFDCAKQVWKFEGPLGFYKGIGPQLIGVAPEKAIKLVVNDYLRGGSVTQRKQVKYIYLWKFWLDLELEQVKSFSLILWRL